MRRGETTNIAKAIGKQKYKGKEQRNNDRDSKITTNSERPKGSSGEKESPNKDICGANIQASINKEKEAR